MTSDDQPELTNSGVTDPPLLNTRRVEIAPGIFDNAMPALHPTSASTPFAIAAASTAIGSVTGTSTGTTMTGCAAIVDAALEEAAQAVILPCVPLAMVDELIAAVQSPAVRSALEARVRMVVEQGHTADADDFLPIGWLPMEARQALERACGALNEDNRDLALVRAALVDAIARGLAAVDRLDRATKLGVESLSARPSKPTGES